jgi:hypothetical protein
MFRLMERRSHPLKSRQRNGFFFIEGRVPVSPPSRLEDGWMDAI